MLAPSASDEMLRRQFQQLQDQQQKRLLQQQQQRQQEKTKKNMEEGSTASNLSFGIEDDLDLKLSNPSSSSAQNSRLMNSESLPEQPDEQIRELKDENGRLYRLLSEKDQEIRQLKKKQDADKALVAAGVSGLTNDSAAAMKIVELSKRIRELTAEVESEKTKAKQIARKYQELGKEVSDDNRNNKSSEMENKELNADELKLTQDKLKQSEAKVMDLRNQIQSLTAELKISQKILAQEVGEGVSMQSLVSGSSGWRGRAQQITVLQKKVNELRKQLEEKIDLGSRSDLSTLEEETMNQTSARNSLIDRQKEQIRKVERQRKENQEKLAEDLKVLEQKNAELKQKVDASKARNSSLSEEMKVLKKQNQLLTEKGKHDNELIEMLVKQQSHWKKLVEGSTRKLQEDTEDAQNSRKHLNANQQLERNTIEQLKIIIQDKEQRIKSLEDEIRNLHLSKSEVDTDHEMASVVSSHLQSDVAAEIIAEILSPNRSRAASRTNSEVPRKTNVDWHELNSLYQAATVECDRLAELVQVLERRIQELTLKSTEAQSELQAERRRNVVLEKQLGKAKLDRVHPDNKQRTKKSTCSSGVRSSISVEDASETIGGLEELQMKLDIQRDENEALKAALQSTLKAKEDDLRLYTSMLEETKKVFLHGIHQCRQSTT